MVNIQKAKEYCCEDISNIENYDAAVKDDKMWDCHHRNEIAMKLSKKELNKANLYFDRPACELIFLTRREHTKLHFNRESKQIVGMQMANKGKKASAETRAKMSEAMKGRVSPTKGKAPWNKGKTLSDETKAKMSATRKGRTIPIEIRAKMSAAQKGRKKSDEHKKRVSEGLKRWWNKRRIA